jgi:hypothetical protein
LPSEYERAFKEELWGCFKYIGIPFETLMNMPVADRKFYIMMHNNKDSNSNSYEEKDNEENDSSLSPSEKEKMEFLSKVKNW